MGVKALALPFADEGKGQNREWHQRWLDQKLGRKAFHHPIVQAAITPTQSPVARPPRPQKTGHKGRLCLLTAHHMLLGSAVTICGKNHRMTSASTIKKK